VDDKNIPEDGLSIAVSLVRETTETLTRFSLEVSMSFSGISPVGRIAALIFVSVILAAIVIIILKKGGNI
jgi:hypothetical protein